MKTFSDLKGGDFLYKICNKKVTKEEVCSTYKYPSGMIYITLMCDLPFEAPKSKSVFKVEKSTHYYYYVINKEDITKYQLIIAKEKLNKMKEQLILSIKKLKKQQENYLEQLKYVRELKSKI